MKRRAILLMALIGAAMLLASGVALAETVTCDASPPCYGTPESDNITGTVIGETIYAMGGADKAIGGGGNDTIYGSSGSDTELNGEEGDDTVYGGGGSDFINAAVFDIDGNTDHVFGGRGNELIFAQDGRVDIVNCGKGTDTVFFDEGTDMVSKNCEIKNPQ